MVLLFLAANLYNIDRLLVGVLAEPIRTDLHIGDFEMGLLLGLAYSVLSGTVGVFIGYLVDRHVRRTILAASIALWSLATMAGGLAPDFKWFFLFRALVGLGEAAVAPAAMSLIADMFPAHRRGRALGGYLIGATVGSALSSIIPGWVVAADLHVTVPHFGLLTPWRLSFLLCGAIGPAVALLFLTVREPARRGADLTSHGGSGVGDNLRYLWRQRRLFGPLYAGFCLFYVALSAIISWTAVFLTRAFHLSVADFGAQLGLMLLIAGGSGYILGGLLADSRWARPYGGRLSMLAVLPLAALPSGFAAFAPGPAPALAMLGAINLAMPMVNVAMNAAIQELVPNAMRGFSYALVGVASALIAGISGPLLVALATEHLFRDPAMIGFSFLVVSMPALLLSAGCFLLAKRAFRQAFDSGGEVSAIVRSSHA